MPTLRPLSLLTQTGLIVGLITLLAVIGISSSFFVTQTIQGAGTTINASGALRMLSHKIGTQMMRDNLEESPDPNQIEEMIERFEQQLNHPSLQQSIPTLASELKKGGKEEEIYNLYQSIQLQWQHNMKPRLISYAALLHTLPAKPLGNNYQIAIRSFHRIYLSKVDTFVTEIDQMVKAIEDQTESQIQLLHDIGYISLLLLLLTILAAPFLFHFKILLPLKDLLKISEQIRHRDFSSQAQYPRQDELGQLAQAFNLMISDLSATYTELEERIADKTKALIDESNRITIMEERNAIAQELHDSLAQSIFYLNIQISRLNTLLEQQADQQQIQQVISELKESSTHTDHQLRELISTFRIQVNPEGMAVAIDEILKRESKRSNTLFEFANDIPDFNFSHNEEVHLIQIIQEATSNISKHAEASHGTIHLYFDQTQQLIQLTISDDGIGIPSSPHRPNHFGLSNMEERASAIHGTLQFKSLEPNGSEIFVSFPPALSQESPL